MRPLVVLIDLPINKKMTVHTIIDTLPGVGILLKSMKMEEDAKRFTVGRLNYLVISKYTEGVKRYLDEELVLDHEDEDENVEEDWLSVSEAGERISCGIIGAANVSPNELSVDESDSTCSPSSACSDEGYIQSSIHTTLLPSTNTEKENGVQFFGQSFEHEQVQQYFYYEHFEYHRSWGNGDGYTHDKHHGDAQIAPYGQHNPNGQYYSQVQHHNDCWNGSSCQYNNGEQYHAGEFYCEEWQSPQVEYCPGESYHGRVSFWPQNHDYIHRQAHLQGWKYDLEQDYNAYEVFHGDQHYSQEQECEGELPDAGEQHGGQGNPCDFGDYFLRHSDSHGHEERYSSSEKHCTGEEINSQNAAARNQPSRCQHWYGQQLSVDRDDYNRMMVNSGAQLSRCSWVLVKHKPVPSKGPVIQVETEEGEIFYPVDVSTYGANWADLEEEDFF